MLLTRNLSTSLCFSLERPVKPKLFSSTRFSFFWDLAAGFVAFSASRQARSQTKQCWLFQKSKVQQPQWFAMHNNLWPSSECDGTDRVTDDCLNQKQASESIGVFEKQHVVLFVCDAGLGLLHVEEPKPSHEFTGLNPTLWERFRMTF